MVLHLPFHSNFFPHLRKAELSLLSVLGYDNSFPFLAPLPNMKTQTLKHNPEVSFKDSY